MAKHDEWFLNDDLYDIPPDSIEKGIATISGNMARQVGSSKLEEKGRNEAIDAFRRPPRWPISPAPIW
nr:hypothetical protein [Mesorhizobium sp. ES1-4]